MNEWVIIWMNKMNEWMNEWMNECQFERVHVHIKGNWSK